MVLPDRLNVPSTGQSMPPPHRCQPPKGSIVGLFFPRHAGSPAHVRVARHGRLSPVVFAATLELMPALNRSPPGQDDLFVSA